MGIDFVFLKKVMWNIIYCQKILKLYSHTDAEKYTHKMQVKNVFKNYRDFYHYII